MSDPTADQPTIGAESTRRLLLPIALRQAGFLIVLVIVPMLLLASHRQGISDKRQDAVREEIASLQATGSSIESVRDRLFARLKDDAETMALAQASTQVESGVATVLDVVSSLHRLVAHEALEQVGDDDPERDFAALQAVVRTMASDMSTEPVQEMIFVHRGTQPRLRLVEYRYEGEDAHGLEILRAEGLLSGNQDWRIALDKARELKSKVWMGWVPYQPAKGNPWPDQSEAVAILVRHSDTKRPEDEVDFLAFLSPPFFEAAVDAFEILGLEGGWFRDQGQQALFATPGWADDPQELNRLLDFSIVGGEREYSLGYVAATAPHAKVRARLRELDGSVDALEGQLARIREQLRTRLEELDEQERLSADWQLATLVLACGAILLGAIRLGHGLRQVRRAAQHLSCGQDARLPSLKRRRDELGDLARSFEETSEVLHGRDLKLASQADQLRSQAQALREHAEHLEERVEERTSELAIARDAAEKAARAKADFLASMSHELRSPLHGVLALTEALAERDLDPESQTLIEEQQGCGEDLLGIINDLLDFSKFEAGGLAVEARPFALSELLGGSVATAQRRATKAGLGFETRIAPELPEALVGDAFRLRQVVVNFISNALKFTHEGGISVVLEAEPSTTAGSVGLRIAVSDTGIGIPADRQRAVFEAFSQAEADTTEKYGGTGLGLTICTKIAEAMGGSVGLESAVGVGSTFFISVRLPQAESSQEASITPGETQARRTPSARILVADDNAVNRRIATLVLEAAGHEVSQVAHGRAALQAQSEAAFDLILMDIHMPEMNGIEATQAIRRADADAGRPRTPVIGLTGEGGERGAAICREATMDAHLTKPFRKEELTALVHGTLNA